MIYTFGFTDPADLRLLEIEAAADAANERFEAGERARERALERGDYEISEGGDRSHGPAPMTHKEQTLMDARHDTCWYRDPVNLAKLWRWLEDQGETPDDPAYFLERPEKWDEEWQRFTRESVVAG